ncbi:flippase [Candidatus Pacearchaeota archaeon]|nr:flippase [Candidatus Pacearchaeota archaeon]
MAGNTVLSMLVSVILARLLGVEGFGAYAYVMAILQVLLILASLGLPPLIVREVAANRAKENWGLIRGLLRWATQTTLMLSIGLGLFAATAVWAFKDYLGLYEYDLVTFWIAMIALPLQSFVRLQAAALRGLRKVVISQLSMRIIRPALFLTLLGAAYLWLRKDFTASKAMSMYVISFGIAFMVGWFLLRKNLSFSIKTTTPVYETRLWMKSALPLLFTFGVVIINNKTDVLMLGAIKGVEDVGIYRVAQRGAELVVLILVAVEMVIAPIISKFYSEGKMQKLQRLATVSVRAIFALSFPFALGLIVFGYRIVPFIFGEKFASSAVPLAILCGSWLVAAGMGSGSELLNMTGHERDTAKATALSATTNVILNSIFIPIWGIEGAAVATGISIILRGILMAVWVTRRIGIHATVLSRLN